MQHRGIGFSENARSRGRLIWRLHGPGKKCGFVVLVFLCVRKKRIKSKGCSRQDRCRRVENIAKSVSEGGTRFVPSARQCKICNGAARRHIVSSTVIALFPRSLLNISPSTVHDCRRHQYKPDRFNTEEYRLRSQSTTWEAVVIFL